MHASTPSHEASTGPGADREHVAGEQIQPAPGAPQGTGAAPVSHHDPSPARAGASQLVPPRTNPLPPRSCEAAAQIRPEPSTGHEDEHGTRDSAPEDTDEQIRNGRRVVSAPLGTVLADDSHHGSAGETAPQITVLSAEEKDTDDDPTSD